MKKKDIYTEILEYLNSKSILGFTYEDYCKKFKKKLHSEDLETFWISIMKDGLIFYKHNSKERTTFNGKKIISFKGREKINHNKKQIQSLYLEKIILGVAVLTLIATIWLGLK